MRDLPPTYPDREFISKSRGWQVVERPYLDRTLEAWAELPEEWVEYWPQAVRWGTLLDKFLRTSDASLSSELRQLERHIVDMIAEAREARLARITGQEPEEPDHSELDAMLDEILNKGE